MSTLRFMKDGLSGEYSGGLKVSKGSLVDTLFEMAERDIVPVGIEMKADTHLVEIFFQHRNKLGDGGKEPGDDLIAELSKGIE